MQNAAILCSAAPISCDHYTPVQFVLIILLSGICVVISLFNHFPKYAHIQRLPWLLLSLSNMYVLIAFLFHSNVSTFLKTRESETQLDQGTERTKRKGLWLWKELSTKQLLGY